VRAMGYAAFGGPITVGDRPDPRPDADGVVLAVTKTGLCRSDWHGWQGHDPDVGLPCVPGHEYTGTVVGVGSSVDRRWMGGRVSVPFICACGSCAQCLAGQGQVCTRQRQPGFTEPGSFAELVAVPYAAVNLIRLPDAVSDEAAAGLGCRFATAWRALRLVGQLEPGESVVVFGAGGVGLAAVMIATAHDASPVVAVDVSQQALQLAADLGAVPVQVRIDDPPDAIADQVRAHLPDGAQVGIDALGSPALARASVLSLGRRGRHVQVGLVAGGLAAVQMDRVVSHELAILGSHGLAATDYPRLLSEVAAGSLRPEALVTGVLCLEEGAAALAALGEPGQPSGVRLIDPTR
jgi:D-arabinose 1-dehydrogenase-like Zn-dependent alcohol dehydrogenase